jgi:hypothetical protein
VTTDQQPKVSDILIGIFAIFLALGIVLAIPFGIYKAVDSIFSNKNDSPCSSGEFLSNGGNCISWDDYNKNNEKLLQSLRKEVSFSAKGSVRGTESKYFSEGNWKVSWQTYGDCYYAGMLEGNNISYSDGKVISASAITFGTSYIYDLKEGYYYMDVITGPSPYCGWDIKFIPIKN